MRPGDGGLRRGLGLLRSFAIYWRPGRQRPLRRLYHPFVKPGDLVFDIGAHLGDRTAAFAALGAMVVAVEPQPQLFRWLLSLFGNHPRVRLVSEAVAEQQGQMQLALSYANPTVASLSAEWRQQLGARADGFRGVHWDASIAVNVTTLDLLIERFGHPSFCKIDVEGAEESVLAGLHHALLALSFEFVTGALEQAERCLAQLQRLGSYQFNAIAGEGRQFLWREWVSMADILAWVKAGAGDIKSGDIYARLDQGSSVARP